MKLLFLHGWAFGADLWHAVTPLLDHECLVADRGYFGASAWPRANGPTVVVAHSLGAMLALRDLPEQCRGLVAVNGFDSFAALADRPGVSARVLERMLVRFEEAPERVVADFRRNAGGEEAPAIADRALLREDLAFLRDGDCRAPTRAADFPVLSLQGGCDAIVPPALRECAFEGAADLRRAICAEGGHLLPLTHPRTCADAIAGFVAGLS